MCRDVYAEFLRDFIEGSFCANYKLKLILCQQKFNSGSQKRNYSKDEDE